MLELAAGEGSSSGVRLRHLAQWGPIENLRSAASVHQHLEKGLPSKGRNELASGKTDRCALGVKEAPPHHGARDPAKPASTGPSITLSSLQMPPHLLPPLPLPL